MTIPQHKHETLTAERLRQDFDCNPETGIVRRKSDGYTGFTNRGYRIINIDQWPYSVHRLVWLFVHGRWPTELDHINGAKADNRIANLREVPHRDNMRNRKMSKHNTTGYKGVERSGNKFVVRIGSKPNRIYVGSFETAELAHKAYCEAAAKLHGEFARFE